MTAPQQPKPFAPQVKTITAAQLAASGAKVDEASNRAFLSTHKWKLKEIALRLKLQTAGVRDLHILVKGDKGNATATVFFRDKFTLGQWTLTDADADELVDGLAKSRQTFDQVMAAVKAHPRVMKAGEKAEGAS